MAADFLARRVPCRGRLGLLITLFQLLIGCSQPAPPVEEVWLESSDGNLQMLNGRLHYAGRPYTGTLLTRYPATEDTAEVARFAEGREHGTWQKYYENGTLMERREFAAGQKVGDYLAWWPSGSKKLHYRFRNGEYEGTCREWNEEGGLIQEMNYKNGHEEGPQKMYYDNGKIRANYTIIGGRRYGLLGTKNCVNVSDSVFANQPDFLPGVFGYPRKN